MHVTEAACEALSMMLARKPNTDRCLRLSTNQGNYRFTIDEPIEQDVIYRFEDRIILVVSETISRDLWGITIDCKLDDGKRKLIFRKSIAPEPMDIAKTDVNLVPPQWRATQHEQLLKEIKDIERQIMALRGAAKSAYRDKRSVLEGQKQVKWDAIRALWAGDGGWHKLQQNEGKVLNGNGASASGAATPQAKTAAR